ncbi:MAG TPA: hypothetical protein VMM35_02665, partial [Longimicrobiales bacterium]|nr:hypothetical protein [Longimicrobiales bacterium]
MTGELAIRVVHAEGECGDLSEPHLDPDALARIEVHGPPNARVEIWASRATCGVEPFLFREVETDATGLAVASVYHDGSFDCADSFLGAWEVWAVAGADRSASAAVVVGSTHCGLGCAAAESFCPPASDGGVLDAGPLPDGGPPAPSDAGPGTGEVRLLAESGCFFTPTEEDKVRAWRIGDVGVVYDRLEMRFDVIMGPWQPHIPDPSNRTEHILFGLSRANQPRSYQRYLMGAAAVDFETRADHFRMFGREEIAMGYESYTQVSGPYAWSLGTRYTVRCSLDASIHQQE